MNPQTKNRLADWAKDYRAEHIDSETQRLINLCTYDLYFGPLGTFDDDGVEWPGFQASCILIREALEYVPQEIYVDDSGFYQFSAPKPERCSECQGEGVVSCSCGHSPPDDCEACDGRGQIEPCYEDWAVYERRTLKAMLVGKELADYV